MLWKPRLANSSETFGPPESVGISIGAVRILGKLTERPLQSIHRSFQLGNASGPPSLKTSSGSWPSGRMQMVTSRFCSNVSRLLDEPP